MIDILRIVLPIYFIAYFGVAFVLKSVIVAKRIGKNPLVLPTDDSAYGLIGLYFKLTLIAMFVYVVALAVNHLFEQLYNFVFYFLFGSVAVAFGNEELVF